MKIKISETTPLQLDWLVVFIQGGCKAEPNANYWLEMWRDPERRYNCDHPSTNWAQGGPIIEREIIDLECERDNHWKALAWDGRDHSTIRTGTGPTPLIAAMRCYVASKLDDEVEVPEDVK